LARTHNTGLHGLALNAKDRFIAYVPELTRWAQRTRRSADGHL